MTKEKKLRNRCEWGVGKTETKSELSDKFLYTDCNVLTFMACLLLLLLLFSPFLPSTDCLNVDVPKKLIAPFDVFFSRLCYYYYSIDFYTHILTYFGDHSVVNRCTELPSFTSSSSIVRRLLYFSQSDFTLT